MIESKGIDPIIREAENSIHNNNNTVEHYYQWGKIHQYWNNYLYCNSFASMMNFIQFNMSFLLFSFMGMNYTLTKTDAKYWFIFPKESIIPHKVTHFSITLCWAAMQGFHGNLTLRMTLAIFQFCFKMTRNVCVCVCMIISVMNNPGKNTEEKKDPASSKQSCLSSQRFWF